MVKEIMEFLVGNPNGTYIDATLGGAGHTSALLNRLSSYAKVYGIDRDQDAHRAAKMRIGNDERFVPVQGPFSDVLIHAESNGIEACNGILADLGVSSFQLDTPERGFSYLREGPLDLRMDTEHGRTAAELLQDVEEKELADILFQFGEEKKSRKIARAIKNQQKTKPISTTMDLTGLLDRVLPPQNRIKSISRVFQALRIAVNDELGELDRFLDGAFQLLAKNGRLAILTYHSLEDRACKNFYKEKSTGCTCPPEFPVCICGKTAQARVITKKAVVATDDEIAANSRARSAKLRVLEKI